MYPHVCSIPRLLRHIPKRVTGALSAYKRNPGDVNAAALCALQQAQKYGIPYLAIPGNSYMRLRYVVSYVGHDNNWIASSNLPTMMGSAMQVIIAYPDGRLCETIVQRPE